MRSFLLAVAVLFLVPAAAMAQQPVQVWAGQPGPYEVHTWQHRTNNFDRAPYFATNPPVYYGDQRLARSYGWTPYPYFGSQYPIMRSVAPMPDGQDASAALPQKAKKEKKVRKSLGA